ncbi:uncharacterized protein KD926_007251 [Aspergillus affinis]|uniref:uncharacterized protein n=1 Tax=Aspergillus affinis TaxID=1070780 RepID=UPI0022FF2B25|nr:uncharacterized protein KD926_007251 [Aspergillus affinis]KAI9041297.1 hypothetical protein KD926_007251 [Aspergillus affinis]
MRRRTRSTDGQEQGVDQDFDRNGDSSTQSNMLRDVEDGTDGTPGRSDGGSTPEKRRQTADSEDQTTVLARVISTVDQDPQTSLSDTTATARPTKTSDVESDRSTTSHTSSDPTSVTHSHRSTADNTSSSETSTVTNASSSSSSSSSDEGLPTASPAYSSPTADTPTMTTGHDASTTGTSVTSGNSTVQLSTQTSHHIISPTTISASSSHRVSSSSAVSTGSMSTSSTSSNSTITTSSTTNSVAIVWTTSESAPTSWSSTGDGWGGGESSATSTTTSAAPTATDVASGGSGSLDSQTKGKIAGGVVGGVAGALILLLVAFLLFRRRKAAARNPVQEALPAGPETGTALGAESVSRSAEMTSRRSSHDPLFTASYFAPAFMKRWRQSNQTTRTDSTITSSTSERGFQKISGRKIPSVLQSGGDGYGGGFEAGSPTTSEPSTIIQPPSPVYPRSPTQPPPSVPYGMPLDTSYTREAEESDARVIFRPSPARTPVAGSASASLSNEPTGSRAVPQLSGALSPTIPKRPDVLGRSHPSFDGSRGSRFSENL